MKISTISTPEQFILYLRIMREVDKALRKPVPVVMSFNKARKRK